MTTILASTGDQLRAAAIENPQDDARRLIWADWLEENGHAKDARRLRRRTYWCLRYWGSHEEDVTRFLKRQQRKGNVALDLERGDVGMAMAAFFPAADARAWMAVYLEGRHPSRLIIDLPGRNNDGHHVVPFLQTTARFDLVLPDGRRLACREYFGFGYAHETVRYLLTDGNGGCDCNRSLLIRRQHPEAGADGLMCGHTIRLENLDIRWEI